MAPFKRAGLVNARGLVQSDAMTQGMRQRAVIVLAFCLVVALLATGVWRYAYRQGLDQLAARGQADLALAGDRLVSQLQRYRDLAVTLADHPSVEGALSGAAPGPVAAELLQVADRSAALDILVVDREGRPVTSALGQVRQDLGGLPFVRRALRGALGWGHGAAQPLTQRAFFHAAPVFAEAGRPRGAVVVITDLNGIDYNWRGTNPAAFFTDAGGEVIVANRSEILFWRRPPGEPGLVPPTGPPPDFSANWLGPHEIWRLSWGPYLPAEALHLTQELPVIGMTGEVLLDVDQTRALALAQAAAVAALCLAFGSLLFLAAERRRALARVNAELETRVALRTAALRETNSKLLEEAREREEAQAALRQAQDELVQAGKLSALGQMSAGISHELNQPLMAIRSFAENGLQFMERERPDRAADNLRRISDMAHRMGRIIQNLRAFARQESRRPARIELGGVIEAALEMTRERVAEAGVTLTYQPPAGQLWVRGGEVRLGQVFVNLITNAVDAMAESDPRRLEIRVTEGPAPEVSFTDSGPGIEVPDKVFDPFYTTKAGGEGGGMGLGLSISYGIVQSLGGQIRGANGPEGGAIFTVTLERAETETEAAA
jgi:two-component system C4-dicarboxylate transport sensor histidine kinase DctB